MSQTLAERTGSPTGATPNSGRSAATWVMVAIALAAGVLLLYAGRHLSFFFDEWDFILGRRGGSVGTYLDPHNGHVSLFPVVVYKLLFALVGLRHYWPYQVVEIALHVLCGWIVYVLARRRMGPWVALAPAMLLLFMGSAYEDLLWPFQMGFLSSVAGGLGALALLDRDGDRADRGACALLLWSLSASGVGIAFLCAAAAMLLAQHRGVHRLWIVGGPALLFVIWYLGWGVSEHPTLQGALGAPQYIVDAASAALAGIAGLPVTYGPPLAVAGVAAVVIALRIRRASPGPLLIAAAVGALAFWGLSAIARADVAEPASSRYIYIGAVFLLLIAAEVATDVVLGRPALALLGLVVLGALIANISLLRSGERSFRSTDETVRASLEAVEVAAPVVAPSFVAEPQLAPQVLAGPFLAAVREFGSPALTLTELERAPPSLRYRVDTVLEHAEQLASVPVRTVTGTHAPTVEMASGGRLVARGSCAAFYPAGPQHFLDLRLRAGTAVLVAARAGGEVSVYVRRFAPGFTEPPFAQFGKMAAVRFPDDLAPELPWHVRVTSPAPFTVCGT